MSTKKCCPPCWQVRLQKKLEQLNKDLNWLTALQAHHLNVQWKISYITAKYQLQFQSVASACETLRQTIKAYIFRLQRYNQSHLAYQQNNMFRFKQHKFYSSLLGQGHDSFVQMQQLNSGQIYGDIAVIIIQMPLG